MAKQHRWDVAVRRIQRQVSSTYTRMKWFDLHAAQSAQDTRDGLLDEISTVAIFSGAGSKLQIGKLSRGCEICAERRGCSLYMHSECVSACFFCPYDHGTRGTLPPVSWGGISYEHPQDFVDFAARFSLEGVAFTGGEPFLAFDRMVGFIEAIRKTLGDDIYLWVYTGGQLCDKEKLQALSTLGLDELRFNVCATEYDLTHVRAAVGCLPKVTVEIPVVPEDWELLRECLPQMHAAGVDHLNLHQLTATPHNIKNFIDRDYTFLHDPSLPVYESEILALELMLHSLKAEVPLPIHYCSAAFKKTFQEIQLTCKAASLVQEDYEEVTRLGYIRRLTLHVQPAEAPPILNRLESEAGSARLWHYNRTMGELRVHPRLLNLIPTGDLHFSLDYFAAHAESVQDSFQGSHSLVLNSGKTVYINRPPVWQALDLHLVTIEGLFNMYREGWKERDALKFFYSAFPLMRNKQSARDMIREKGILIHAGNYERSETGMAEIL